MEKPAVKYRVALDHAARQYKVFDTEEAAIAFAHEIMEADGDCVFMKGTRDYNDKLTLFWMKWDQAAPRMVSKTIGIANQAELDAYEAWLDEQEAQKAIKRIQQIVVKKPTMAVRWI